MALPLKALLFLGGASGATLGTAYLAGVFDPQAMQPAGIAQPATPPAPAKAETQTAEAPASPSPPAQPANPVAPDAMPAEQQVAAAQPEKPVVMPEVGTPVAPSFDILRVEPDGSMVIAGKAMAGSNVEALVGSRLIGKATTTPGGDFVIILEEPLKPGDYQVVLRSTGPGTMVLSSVETAVVSVPATPDGQVLALVEQPGAPSKLITVTPEPAPAQPPPSSATDNTAQPPAATTPATPAAATPAVSVEAVEIDGRKVFVAGAAPAGSNLRAYANEILLGDAKASPEGRFLFETERNLAVGDYIVRVDQLSPNGDKVLSRATVPFKREAGDSVAAVAPVQPATIAKPAAPAPASSPGTTPLPATQPNNSAETPDASGAATPPPAGAAATTPASDPAQVATAPQLEASASGVIIRRGDTLWRISKRVYGRGTRYSTIYTANRPQIADPNRIWPGQVFRVPDKSDEGEDADMNAMEGQATKL